MQLHNGPSLGRADDSMSSVRHRLIAHFALASIVYTTAIRMKIFHQFTLLHVKIFRGIFHPNEAPRSHTTASRFNNLRKPMLFLIVAEQTNIIYKMMA